MKKFKVIIPILAVFVAVVAAFATPPVSDYRKHQAGIGCVDQTECTLNTGNIVQLYAAECVLSGSVMA